MDNSKLPDIMLKYHKTKKFKHGNVSIAKADARAFSEGNRLEEVGIRRKTRRNKIALTGSAYVKKVSRVKAST